MKNFFTLALLSAAAMARLRYSNQEEKAFMGFAAEFARSYSDVEELEMRLAIFQANRNEVQ